MLKKVLIANRGEIACRIIRTARKMGIATVAVFSDADAKALHVAEADERVHIGASPATESYLAIDKIISAAKQTGTDSIHPGYGFLSENADFAADAGKAGLIFVGPTPEAMRALGGKAAAKEIAIKAGVPVVPGYQGDKQDSKSLATEAAKIGYPVMIKAVAGGGGRGMRLVDKEADLADLLDSAKREAQSAFGNAQVLIEKVVVRPRHIEVQVFGDSHGNVVHLFERDCTLQRRNQKVIEEAPAPGMSPELRAKMCDAAVKLAKAVGYRGAGTVEFLVEGGSLAADATWYFIEMNTRLQVEHPVTEEITGLDLVEWQFRVAAGEALPRKQADITMRGHAIELRICAEDPAKDFRPSIGRIAVFDATKIAPLRLEAGVRSGDSISPFYDSMIAKLIGRGETRNQALAMLASGLHHLIIAGPRTNARFLRNLLVDSDVREFRMDTGLIARKLTVLTDDSISPATIARGMRGLMYLANAPSSSVKTTPDPWSRSDGFMLGTVRASLRPVRLDGVDRAIRIHHGGSDGAEVQFSFDPWPGVRKDAATPPLVMRADRQERIYVIDDLVQTEFEWPAYDTSAIDDGADGAAIRAPINGRIAKLHVKAGDAVEKGTRVAVVEAMKMEHVVTASAAGKIEKIATHEGDQITQGAIIAAVALS
jgi:3-methylcrotonyl-CoA carboxylase alpha subunit